MQFINLPEILINMLQNNFRSKTARFWDHKYHESQNMHLVLTLYSPKIKTFYLRVEHIVLNFIHCLFLKFCTKVIPEFFKKINLGNMRQNFISKIKIGKEKIVHILTQIFF